MNESAAREGILNRIRRGKPANVPAPKVPMYGWPGDIKQNFIKMLESFDGKAIEFDTRQDAINWLNQNVDTQTKRVCSAIDDYKGNCTPADYPDPHKATDIDVSVVQGLLGVGEMGSVYLTDTSMGKPACSLLSTDMFVLLDSTFLVQSMHQAYAALNIGTNAYGSFFTGPSATADIEAVHVTGAQGQISLTVLLYDKK